MATTTHQVTVQEFSQLPDHPSGRHHELRHGQVILMSAPPRYYADLQDNTFDGLKSRCGTLYRIRTEMACRPLPEYEVWAPDIGLTTKERWNATRNDDWLAGSPELAIEVLSPSNTKREMEDRRATLFAGGCRHFWTVDARSRSVTVSTPDGAHQTY